MLPLLTQFFKAVLTQAVVVLCTVMVDMIRRSMGDARP